MKMPESYRFITLNRVHDSGDEESYVTLALQKKAVSKRLTTLFIVNVAQSYKKKNDKSPTSS